MATTIEALRKLGKKVNDKEPTSNGIGNIVNEIADDYAGGSGSAGVSSIGGVDGAITLGEGLSMSGQELQVSVSGGGLEVLDLDLSNLAVFEVNGFGMSMGIDIPSDIYNSIYDGSYYIINAYSTNSESPLGTFNQAFYKSGNLIYDEYATSVIISPGGSDANMSYVKLYTDNSALHPNSIVLDFIQIRVNTIE